MKKALHFPLNSSYYYLHVMRPKYFSLHLMFCRHQTQSVQIWTIIYFILSFLVWLIECYLLRHSSQDLMSEKSVIGPTLLNLNDLRTTSCCPWLLGFSHYLYPLSCIMGFTLVDRSLVPWHASYFKYNVCGLFITLVILTWI